MQTPALIGGRICVVGGPELTDPRDCMVYLLSIQGEQLLIDAGAGPSAPAILKNIERASPGAVLRTLVLTHGHIDHVGGAAEIKRRTGCRIVAHELDMDAIQGRNPSKSAEGWYGIRLEPVGVDDILRSEEERRIVGGVELHLLHTPGHTPGSIVVWADIEGKKVLFGQDIHGPFDPDFGSDIDEWRRSMSRVLALEADILCEGHFGVFEGKERVKRFIEGYLREV
ncbi:MAG: MBL fold metallo-hydrolase [Thermoplasmata archaeon]